MKKIVVGLLCEILLLTACGHTVSTTPIAPIPVSNTATSTSSPIPTTTATSLPTETLTPSITPLPTIPTFTPTFDVSRIVTVTPAKQEQCPAINQDIKLDFNFSLYENDSLDILNKKTLEFLNKGGNPKIIIEKIGGMNYYPSDRRYKEHALEIDVTGDGIPELLIAPDLYVSIFGCKDGVYRSMDTYMPADPFGMDYEGVVDINKNGIPEIYSYTTECMGGRCHYLFADEWNGTEFHSVILDGVGHTGTNPEHYCDDLNEPFETSFKDIDKDGLAELIVIGHIPSWPDDLLFPYRAETRICKWNGQGFVFYKKEFSEPRYRFQAIQDADLAASQGEYSKALALYQRVISDQNLEWWSPWRRIHEYEKLTANFFQSNSLPTPDPTLKPDPAEFPSLAAYAYYRMMILYTYMGKINDATEKYNVLQENFGENRYGNNYTEMAVVFWNEYGKLQSMKSACESVIIYATKHPDILVPLGSNYHGYQSHWYKPEDVCPFR